MSELSSTRKCGSGFSPTRIEAAFLFPGPSAGEEEFMEEVIETPRTQLLARVYRAVLSWPEAEEEDDQRKERGGAEHAPQEEKES
jgi:hypothetical protein